MPSNETIEYRIAEIEKRVIALSKTINGNGEEGLKSRVTVIENHITQLHEDQKTIVQELKALNDSHKKAVGGIMAGIALFNAVLMVAVKLWT